MRIDAAALGFHLMMIMMLLVAAGDGKEEASKMMMMLGLWGEMGQELLSSTGMHSHSQ